MNKKLLSLLPLLSITTFLAAQVPGDTVAIQNPDSMAVSQDTAALKAEPANAVPQISGKLAIDYGSPKAKGARSNSNCIYHIKPAIDVPVAIAGIAGTILGFSLISQKPNSDSGVIANLHKSDLTWGLNRTFADHFSIKADNTSDFFLYGGFVYGFVLLLDHDIRQDALKVGLLYVQTMGITGTSYSMTAASVTKYRPYVYNTDSIIENGVKVPKVPFDKKTNYNATNSFYGGHPSVPAASCLFVASVYSAYHPHSAFRFVLYGVAVAATGTTAYLRYRAGNHFPTDLAIGITLGTAYGLVNPYIHRCKDGSGLSMAPMMGEVKGMNFAYTF